jgi:hypothetical protein
MKGATLPGAGSGWDVQNRSPAMSGACAGTIGRKTPDGKVIESNEDFAAYLLMEAGGQSLQSRVARGNGDVRLSARVTRRQATF